MLPGQGPKFGQLASRLAQGRSIATFPVILKREMARFSSIVDVGGHAARYVGANMAVSSTVPATSVTRPKDKR
jgi:hypothetical protein